MQSTKRSFDVLVVGGGPTGSSAAIRLAQKGLSVALLERSTYDTPRIGETLPPDAKLPLCELGVWEQFLEANHLPSPGNLSIWGNDTPAENDFMFSPHGSGWHLNRVLFDQMLSQAAEKRGVRVFTGTTVRELCELRGGQWRLNALSGSRQVAFESDYLVLAMGRNAGIKLPCQAKKIYDRLVGVVKFLDLEEQTAKLDHRTVIEASENGWWYSAVLPQRKLVVAYMTDADLLTKGAKTSASEWVRLLGGTTCTKRRVRDCKWNMETRIFAAHTYFSLESCGRNWLAIGDQAFTYDPLSGQGILKAINAGIESGEAIASSILRNPGSLREYSERRLSTFEQYLAERHRYYCREKRWPFSQFWQRRHALPM